MSRIDELIKEYCPDGVEYKSLDNICVIQNGYTPSKAVSEYWEDGNIPWIRMEDIRTNGRVLDDAIQHINDKGVRGTVFPAYSLVFATTATVGEHALITVPFVCNQQLTHIHIADNYKDRVSINYLSHYAFEIDRLCRENTKGGSSLPAVDLSKFRAFRIPLPPLQVQCEIVRILDNFTELTAELTAELTTRKKQYQFYLDQFYGKSYKELLDDGNYTTLDKIGTFQRGKRFVKADSEGLESGIPCVHYGELYTHYGVVAHKSKSFLKEELVETKNLRKAKYGDVIIVGAGENNTDIGVGVVWLGDEDIVVHDACYTYTHSQNPKYISYYLRSNIYHDQIKKYVSEGKICAISSEGIGKSIIPLPPIEEQNRIVKLLDSFYSLSNNISEGLPAEIEARQKQYEYYRDKLLTFKELEV